MDAARVGFVFGDAVGAHRLQRRLLRREVVVEARLPDAEHVGNVLRRGAVVAAAREDLGRGRHDLGGAALARSGEDQGFLGGTGLHAGVFY